MKTVRRFLKMLVVLAVIVIGGAIAYALSGHYDMSVGTGHTAVTQWYLDTLRERSIARRAAEITVPALDEDGMVAAGARGYEQACAGCHGRPGREASANFDPRPPALTRNRADPAATYWVTRNGIKMSAMPRRNEEQLADTDIWDIAAFLQVAPAMTEGEYREIVEQTPEEPESELEPEPEPGIAADDGQDEDSEDDDANIEAGP